MEMEGERSIACAAVERQEVSNSTRLLIRIRETTEQLPPMRIRARGDWFRFPNLLFPWWLPGNPFWGWSGLDQG